MRWLLSSLLFVLLFSNNLNASSESERSIRSKALDDIFTSLEDENNKNKTENDLLIEREVTQYASKYMSIIKNKLGDLSEYSGETCRLSIIISDEGKIKNAKSDIESDLCYKAINKIKSIKYLPMPKDLQVKSKLYDINLTINPN